MLLEAQSFEHLSGKLLPMQPSNVFSVKKRGVLEIIAENLGYFMNRIDCEYPNANALGKAAKVSPNTVRNLRHPERRTKTIKKGQGYPTVDKLEALAAKLPKCETWMLLHPELRRALRAMEMDTKIQTEYTRPPDEGGQTAMGKNTNEDQREGARSAKKLKVPTDKNIERILGLPPRR
jgi:hypothetical protein